MSHPWKHSRSGLMALWGTWSGWRCPCSLQGVWTRWSVKIPSNPNYSMSLWFRLHFPRVNSEPLLRPSYSFISVKWCTKPATGRRPARCNCPGVRPHGRLSRAVPTAGRQEPADVLAAMLGTSGAAYRPAEMGKMVTHADNSWLSGQKSTVVTRQEQAT